ncbi:MAG: rRNA pseudouridine synthase [Bacteriovoracaceae bacterium]|nr:rRNA pseudouridine synthase [Bacteriovoracaceae bacterium]
MSKSNQNLSIRLQKVIADCGVTSRRKAEGYILDGRVTVNDRIVTELGTKVNPHTDTITVDGVNLELAAVDKVYIVMNKPRAYITTLSDPEGRPTVMELIYGVKQRIFPVGRLDYLSEGLLILTNDGDLANMIMHPKYEVEKVYEVKVFGHVNEALLAKIKRGVMTEDGLLKPKSVRVIEQLPNKTWLEFRLNEGKNREIRKICDAVDLTVDKLRRVAIEGLNIQSLPVGQYMFTTRKELLKALGLNEHGEKVALRKFVSAKKTLNTAKVAKIVSKTARPADDKKFQSFRKESYYETVASIKDLKMRQAEEEATKLAETEAQEKAARFAKTIRPAPKAKGYGSQN